jgi:hypothetical protein
MPYAYTIDSDRDAVLVRVEGVHGDSEALVLVRELVSDVKYHRGMRVLVDFTGLTQNNVSSSGLREVVAVLKPAPDSRRAFLVGNLTDFGISRMYQAFCELNGFHSPEIFRTRKEAVDFLNEGFPPEKKIP